MTTRIMFNGQEYPSTEAMPENIRNAYLEAQRSGHSTRPTIPWHGYSRFCRVSAGGVATFGAGRGADSSKRRLCVLGLSLVAGRAGRRHRMGSAK
jgi:hypothetical protein